MLSDYTNRFSTDISGVLYSKIFSICCMWLMIPFYIISAEAGVYSCAKQY
jgi:hypothetical protein